MAPQHIWGAAPFTVTLRDGSASSLIVKGRDRWALEALIDAGDVGCTSFDNPAPRWSSYVFNLRGMGVDIETLPEAHSGPFSGHHGRYVLRCRVQRIVRGDAA
ncbi:hypothetical protein Q4543_16645 [Salipiger sp. 1_MG-2023]|uniref:winged helix domain-containing protein n=1 Tax=Salipiger sp. 1_MG-2023 TaxID=3062665 RepID=UPI0026E42D94|nr:hypothetical protein [Salipiger sp. 1_MG-2023]MDO6587138.1 hypothetical protein [Salipiger sp. 1_MG-2023]MDO6587145.1 hypothetical protein [Salipiger sp. 1_MG-2023]